MRTRTLLTARNPSDFFEAKMRLPRKAALVALLNQKAPAVFLQRFPHFTERQHAPPSTGMAPSEAFLRLKELRKRTGAAVPGEERQNAAGAAASDALLL